MSIWISSSMSGKTKTEANEVWRRALASKARCGRDGECRLRPSRSRTHTPFDREGGALQTRTLTGLELDELDAEAAALAPAEVHAPAASRPSPAPRARGAGVDLDDRVAAVVLAARRRRSSSSARPCSTSSTFAVSSPSASDAPSSASSRKTCASSTPWRWRRKRSIASRTRPSRGPRPGPSRILPEIRRAGLLAQLRARRSRAGRSKMPPELGDAMVKRAHAVAQSGEQRSSVMGRSVPCGGAYPKAARAASDVHGVRGSRRRGSPRGRSAAGPRRPSRPSR